MSQPGTVGHGMPARPNDVQRELRDLQRQIDQMHGMVVQAVNTASMAATTAQNAANTAQSAADTAQSAADTANAATMVTKSTQFDDNSMNISTTATEYGVKTVTVPTGYTRAYVSVFASAGLTVSSTSGNTSVRPVLEWSNPDQVEGPAINSGDFPNGSPAVASSFFAAQLTGLTGGQTLKTSCLAIMVGTATSGSGNIHVASSWIFTKS